jgi:glycogen(starch) synthase
MRTVLMTADAVGGIWTYALELAAALAPHGIQVHLAIMGAPLTAAQRDQIAQLPTVTLHESTFKLEWMENPWDDVARAGEWLLQLEQSIAPDVVHLNGYVHASLQWRSPVLVVGHSCVLSWWRAVRGCEAPGTWSQYAAKVGAGIHSAAQVVAPSQAMLDALQRHYGFIGNSCAIPNGRDASRFSIGEKQPYVLAAGRLWDEAKNIAALDAVAKNVSWPVLVAGESNRQTRFQSLVQLGTLTENALASYMSHAAIYALPARYEPFGLSVLEAALSGCALVLGDIESLRENWDGAALFVAPDDPLQLERALQLLIDRPVKRRALAAAAHSRAQHFTPAQMAELYLNQYERLSAPVAIHSIAAETQP